MTGADKLTRLNHLYAVSSGINEAIVRIPDERRLYEEACRIAVEKGGLMMAWVGLADPASGTLRPVASAGKNDGYVQAIRVTTHEGEPEGRGPGGEAFRTGRAAVCNDIAGDHYFFASKTEALARGYRSCAAFALTAGGHSTGVFLVYAAQPMYFDQEELQLLTALAENFSFAIEARRREAERQHAEQEVRHLADRLVTTLESVTDAFITVDRQWRFTYVNREAERLLQRSREGLLGRSMWAEFPDGRGTVFETAYVRAIEENRSVEIEEFYPPLAAWLEVRIYPSHQGLTIYFRDVSDRRRSRDEILRLNTELEQRVRQRTAQLELANGELEAFSYSVAHDLRAPLAAISGFSHALESELGASANPRVRHYLKRSREGVRQTGEMIDALLSLARLSRAALRWEPVDLGAMARSALEDLRQREPCEAVLTVQEGLQAHGDPRLLQLVIDNLVGNAWKFSAQRACREITVGVQQPEDGEKVFFVRDNGAGFDMTHAGNLFGAFQRMHTQAEFPGTGVGLANVRRITSRHSGRVWAESRPGEGATFYFTLGNEPA